MSECQKMHIYIVVTSGVCLKLHEVAEDLSFTSKNIQEMCNSSDLSYSRKTCA